MLCLLLCVDHERKTFTHPLASSLSQAYTSYLDGLSIEAVISPFGSVAESKQVLYLASLDIVRKWSDFRRRALSQGLQSLFCYPILSSAGEVMAVFALYYNKAQDAPAHDMELGSRAVKMIAILMERHQALKESHKKEQLLSQINSFIPGALYGFKIDKEGKISFPFYSAKMGELFNMDALEVENNIEGLFEKIHPEDRDAFWHSIQVSAQSMRPWLFDYRAIKGDSNEIMWLRGHSIPRSTDNGSILWYGLLVDITDIKKK
jgi:PAS domain-containing protein